jgi:hypothetical protein
MLVRLRAAAQTEEGPTPARADLWPRIEARLPSAPTPRVFAPPLRWGAAAGVALIAAIAVAFPLVLPAPPMRQQSASLSRIARRVSPPAVRKLPHAPPPAERMAAARNKIAPPADLPDPFAPPQKMAVTTPLPHHSAAAPVRIAQARPPVLITRPGLSVTSAEDASARMSPVSVPPVSPQTAAPIKSDNSESLPVTRPPAPAPESKLPSTDGGLSVDALRRQLGRAPAASAARIATMRDLAIAYLTNGDTRLALDSWQAAL